MFVFLITHYYIKQYLARIFSLKQRKYTVAVIIIEDLGSFLNNPCIMHSECIVGNKEHSQHLSHPKVLTFILHDWDKLRRCETTQFNNSQ